MSVGDKKPKRKIVIGGMIYGQADWVDKAKAEVGLYMRTHVSDKEKATRVVLHGPEIKRQIDAGTLTKGMAVIAFGPLSARIVTMRASSQKECEMVCTPTKVTTETLQQRSKGAMYANIKGVILNYDAAFQQVKSYLNIGDEGVDYQLTISVTLKRWISGLAPERRENFIAGLKAGREYTASALVDASLYVDRNGKDQAVLQLLPTDFSLQN
ncbi:hypothetical protein [Comamonas thiooxydans]|uniref:hypothetical protein n=1 Tax=Comamonas thiooxydans TaxID=363952 RepID=UPI000B41D799|nr:hypothetical protein [Comamonas thiooxydans]